MITNELSEFQANISMPLSIPKLIPLSKSELAIEIRFVDISNIFPGSTLNRFIKRMPARRLIANETANAIINLIQALNKRDLRKIIGVGPFPQLFVQKYNVFLLCP